MKTQPTKLAPQTVLHAQAAPLSGTVSGSTYELELASSDGKVLVRVKKVGAKDTFRWTNHEDLTD